MIFPAKKEKANKNELINRCDALYAWHKDALYKMALKALGGDEEWALAVLEKCMMVAYEYIDLLGNEKSDKTKAIMAAILQGVLNEIYQDAWKNLGAQSTSETQVTTQKDRVYADEVLTRNQMSANLAKYVEKLSRKERELVLFRFFAGFSEEELQTYYKINKNETEARIASVKQKIARMMVEG